MTKNLPKLIVILGPTAVGKTALAINLAKKFKGEIVSADSRQVYKKIDIGTAKPTKKETGDVPYHLIDIIWPDQEFNVAIYKKLALRKIKEIQKKEKLPFLVGGTGLYIQAIVDNIEFPRVSPQKNLRKKLELRTEKELFKIYKKLDPEGAKFIDKKNKRRLIRAIEVCKMEGSSFWKKRKIGKPLFDVLQIGLLLEKESLKEKIRERIEKMFKMGLEQEAKKLIKKYDWSPALQTIGYQEWFSFAKASKNKKKISLPLTKIEREKIKETIQLHTIQLAKRQMTWFKRHPTPQPKRRTSSLRGGQVRCGAVKKIHWLKNYKEAEKLVKNFLLK